MDLKEICFRDKELMLQQGELEYVVKEYIKERKGKTIDIDIVTPTNLQEAMFPEHKLMDQLPKLVEAFAIASSWFRLNKFK